MDVAIDEPNGEVRMYAVRESAGIIGIFG